MLYVRLFVKSGRHYTINEKTETDRVKTQ